MVETDRDRLYMERALLRAEQGRGRTSPNPIVGAVVVSVGGVVVGQGAHLKAGGPHAEIAALDQAGDLARGATLYCTLEPCSHVGRTGPCVTRIVAAGVARVVAALTDPNPKVSGRGFAYLRAHGVAVSSGLCEDAARAQNAPYLTWIRLGRPFVIAKAASSSDGFVGVGAGAIRLTGPETDRHFHEQRAEIDAIAVGSGTVLADEPELTARGPSRFRPLTRVLFDWRGRIRSSARVFSTLPAGPVIMVVSRQARDAGLARYDALEARGVELHTPESRDLGAVLQWLGGREIVSLLVEGGPTLHGAFAEADLIDRVQLITTPATLERGVPVAPALKRLEARAGARVRRIRLGDDVVSEFDVHRPD